MISWEELYVLFMCVEWFLYGKISVLCALTCTLAKEVRLTPGLGIYCGIFAIYIHCVLARKESRESNTIFYALCLLFVLSTAAVVSDVLKCIIDVSNIFISRNIIFLSVMQTRIATLPVQLQNDSHWQSMSNRVSFFQCTFNGCCDLIAQCTLVHIIHCTYHLFYSHKSSKIYRCWIVWGKNIQVVIIPLFLAITYIGQWIYPHLISRCQFIASSYLVGINRRTWHSTF